MKIDIITIGDELLIGQVINTNAAWMAELLLGAGFPVSRMLTVGDTLDDIIQAIHDGFAHADILLLSGGLGPTSDDRTREALCVYFGSKLVPDEGSLKSIEGLFLKRGWAMSPANLKQAEVVEGCIVIKNPIGTSPGMCLEKGEKLLMAFPGVPFELQRMLEYEALPLLRTRYKPRAVAKKTILTQGVGESFLAERIAKWEESLPEHISLAYLPQPGMVRLRLMAIGDAESDLQAEVEQQLEQLQKIIPELIFGYDDDTLEARVGALLLQAGASLSTAESCTGGYIAHLITSVAGSSAYFKGSVVSYHNDVKINELGVSGDDIASYGAVSEQVVRQMAEGVRHRLDTTYSIAVSGIAGPDGGSDAKPVGTTWVAVAGPTDTLTTLFSFGDHRERNIRRAALSALNMLRRMLENDLKKRG